MLTDHMKAGTLLLGLSGLINTPKQGFPGCYRVVQVGATTAVEFFEAAKRSDASKMERIMILPYRPGKISTVGVSGTEVISGEFTGCVMALYRDDNGISAAHVDTNPDTTQRAQWDDRKNDVTLLAEYDTTGKILAHPGAGASTVILCVGRGDNLKHYFVNKRTHQYSKLMAGVVGDDELKWRQGSETAYEVMAPRGD